MSSSFFARASARRIALAGGGLTAAGLTANEISRRSESHRILQTAETEFHTSSSQAVPSDWKGRVFKIRNDYPNPKPLGAQALPAMPGPDLPTPGGGIEQDAPWLKIDFLQDPYAYCEIVRKYCWEGNVNNGFVVQNNRVYQPSVLCFFFFSLCFGEEEDT